MNTENLNNKEIMKTKEQAILAKAIEIFNENSDMRTMTEAIDLAIKNTDQKIFAAPYDYYRGRRFMGDYKSNMEEHGKHPIYILDAIHLFKELEVLEWKRIRESQMATFK